MDIYKLGLTITATINVSGKKQSLLQVYQRTKKNKTIKPIISFKHNVAIMSYEKV